LKTMIDKSELIKLCEESVLTLKSVFRSKSNEYFFTEKEIHSYLYHLCTETGRFEHDDYCLIHTEYPTPFKCEMIKQEPFIKKVDDRSNNQRAHIDLVVINPNFIDWVKKNSHSYRLISGIGVKRFDLYISQFKEIYAGFCDEAGESILLYAIEFKYLRHSYSGEKYPIREILQDIYKLRMLQEFKLGTKKQIGFCEHVKSIVFVGERNLGIIKKLNNLAANHKGLCEIVHK